MNHDQQTSPPCEFLAWDSEFFTRRIARVRGETLAPDQIARVDQWCGANKIDCLYFLARPDDATTPRVAEQSGFQLTDIRVTFEQSLAAFKPNAALLTGTRPATEADLPRLREIARSSHGDTRFYYDGHFPRSRCDDLYEKWITVSFQGYAQAVFVAHAANSPDPVGYVTVHADAAGARIGLIAVAEPKKGWGTRLLHRSLAWFTERQLPSATITTQGRNIAAQRLCQRSGFLLRGIHLHYHKWYHG